ncbi:MAG TPA: hypothetical protein VET45_01000 [Candidatus Binatia bacterium]|nr:hypothetical protein [Candidatus Binatia bacterium]
MRSVELVVLALTLSSVLRFGLPDSAEAAGPWQAQVVSAETKQPLEGVVVLAWWTKHVRSFGGPSEEYRDSQEVLTDKDGRFTIASRWFFSLNPLVFFRGPFFAFFKSGYGQDRWPGYEELGQEGRKALAMYANLLQLDGIVLEMPRLHDMEQRRKHLQRLEIQGLGVPLEKRPLLQNAVVEERKALGYRSRIHP